MNKSKQKKKIINFDNFKGDPNQKPVGLCGLAMPKEEREKKEDEDN